MNFLAKRASEDYEPINFDFFDKDLTAFSHDEEEIFEKLSLSRRIIIKGSAIADFFTKRA